MKWVFELVSHRDESSSYSTEASSNSQTSVNLTDDTQQQSDDQESDQLPSRKRESDQLEDALSATYDPNLLHHQIHLSLGNAEQADRGDPLYGEASLSREMVGHYLNMKLLYLKNREKLGKRFFAPCSEVLNRIMDGDGLPELAYIENGTEEERHKKKQRYMELQDLLSNEDNQESERSNNSSSSCSSSISSESIDVIRSKGVCVDEDCSHVACRPAVHFMMEVLYASCVFQVPELVTLYQRRLIDILDKVAVDDVLTVLSIADICGKACERLLTRSIEIIVKSDADVVTLDKALSQHIVKQITDSRLELGLNTPESTSYPDKHVKRILRALDADDVELVRMLLKGAHTNLDDAHALHYAVAYCDAKTTAELLDLGIANVNSRNSRGYSVLHVAAMRKEPKIIVSLLTKGARPSDLTSDGRKALQILKQLTRAVDYYKSIEEGKASPKERLCIEILEQAERRDPLLGEASLSLAMAGDDLRMKLLYLENRVGLAKLIFPMEAKVAMDIAHVDGTYEFTLTNVRSKISAGVQRITVDLNEAPFFIQEEHLKRMRALSKTVELGKRFFPRCSEVLNRIIDEDLSQLGYIENDTEEERYTKKQRYMELQNLLSNAFNEDKQEFDSRELCILLSKGYDIPLDQTQPACSTTS
ncbi:BTB/POZ domain and ankyrin repeat-containing protein NPR1-like [Mercurialis annua]|uniref:BTB/POZ domain and ankyrin repeat-containing protein NPR1-like n=1 Tax=Mercurialis annua TaxID=3986 RepID=UPI00215E345F|nr:BTB/POZ domain and ankyrin repeat-containing protein NPR1-like [Mercurialis annua]